MRYLALLLVLIAVSSRAGADEIANLGKRITVDLLVVRGEGELRGLVVSQSRSEIVFAVRREWMAARHPGWLDRIETNGAKKAEESQDRQKSRLDEWKRELEANADRNRQLLATIGLIEEETQQKAEKARKAAEDKEAPEKSATFVLVTVPADQARRVIRQPAEKRQLACVAWEDGVAGVEELPFPKLQQSLNKSDKEWPNRATRIVDQIPGANEGDPEWSARTAIWEYQFGERVTFQGTGDSVFRTDRSDLQPSLAQIVPSIVQGSALKDLSGLLDGGPPVLHPPAAPGAAGRKSAIAQADQAKVRSFRLTMVNMSLERSAADVVSEFVVKLPQGGWTTIWRETVSESTATPRKEAEDRIRQDPQLAEALKITQALGVQGEIEKAIRAGAATMAAQQAIDTRFSRWGEAMTQRFDGPPVTLQPQ